MGMGTKLELIEAKPWPPENGVIPPVGLKWYERYWPYLGVGGIGIAGVIIALAKKKK